MNVDTHVLMFVGFVRFFVLGYAAYAVFKVDPRFKCFPTTYDQPALALRHLGLLASDPTQQDSAFRSEH